MELLLDARALLWWLADDPRLGRHARAEIAKHSNSIYVSAAAAWEIATKRAIGKLEAPGRIAAWIDEEGFLELPISVAHAVRSVELPAHHRDPFDRLMIAQAQLEDLTLVARDDRIDAYDVSILDASD